MPGGSGVPRLVKHALLVSCAAGHATSSGTLDWLPFDAAGLEAMAAPATLPRCATCSEPTEHTLGIACFVPPEAVDTLVCVAAKGGPARWWLAVERPPAGVEELPRYAMDLLHGELRAQPAPVDAGELALSEAWGRPLDAAALLAEAAVTAPAEGLTTATAGPGLAFVLARNADGGLSAAALLDTLEDAGSATLGEPASPHGHLQAPFEPGPGWVGRACADVGVAVEALEDRFRAWGFTEIEVDGLTVRGTVGGIAREISARDVVARAVELPATLGDAAGALAMAASQDAVALARATPHGGLGVPPFRGPAHDTARLDHRGWSCPRCAEPWLMNHVRPAGFAEARGLVATATFADIVGSQFELVLTVECEHALLHVRADVDPGTWFDEMRAATGGRQGDVGRFRLVAHPLELADGASTAVLLSGRGVATLPTEEHLAENLRRQLVRELDLPPSTRFHTWAASTDRLYVSTQSEDTGRFPAEIRAIRQRDLDTDRFRLFDGIPLGMLAGLVPRSVYPQGDIEIAWDRPGGARRHAA